MLFLPSSKDRVKCGWWLRKAYISNLLLSLEPFEMFVRKLKLRGPLVCLVFCHTWLHRGFSVKLSIYGKFRLARWSHKVALFPVRIPPTHPSTHPPTHPPPMLEMPESCAVSPPWPDTLKCNDFLNRKWNYPNRKWNYLNRKWNYFTHFQTSDQKTYFKKCISF